MAKKKFRCKSDAQKKAIRASYARIAKKSEVKSSLFKFRRYKKTEGGETKKAKHPKLIVDEVKDDYGFMGLTESKKRGHHNNIPLTKNPQKGRNEPAYLRDELRYDNKDNFGDVLPDYNLSEEDKPIILDYLKRHKKKK